MHDLTGFERDVLYVIATEDGMKGLEIKGEIRDYYGEEIYDGRLYPALDKLVEKGLVQKGKVDDRTNDYRLSKRGRLEVEYRRRWEDEALEEFFDGVEGQRDN